ncbi:MAG: hypothetical protein CMN10_18760 [Roseobacter sp.]|nr:hypothetical protein [Roseobacter sp.]
MNHFKVAIIPLLLALPPSTAIADRTDLPQTYYKHGLIEDAKREFIAVTFDRKADDEEKAKSLSALGDIAFDESKTALALATWRELIETYPESKEAKLVSERIGQLGQAVEESTGETLDNAIARSYIRHGDFWSRGKEEKLTIDSSWIPSDKAAIGWFDRVINEFPDTPAATLALKKKFYTLNGWKEPGQYGSEYGLAKMPSRVDPLIQVFEELKVASPNDPDLQRFRYMIAQGFWKAKKFDQTREWLQKIIDDDQGKGGFYKDLAEWRLKKVEY